MSYAKQVRRVGGLGALLDALGLAPGGRFGVLAVNFQAHSSAGWACRPTRGLVDLNVRLSENELAGLIDDAGVEALLVDGAQPEVGRALRGRSHSRRETPTGPSCTSPRNSPSRAASLWAATELALRQRA